MASALAGANYLYLLPAIAAYFAAVLFRTWRWKYLLAPMRPIPLARLFPVVVVGYMANNLLPARLGEVVRSYYLGQREGVSATSALATVVVERVYDGLALLFLLAVTALFLPVAGLVGQLSQSTHLPAWLLSAVGVAPFLAVMVALVGASLYPGKALWVGQQLARPLPLRWRARAMHLGVRFIEGLHVLRSPRRLVTVFLWSLPVWLSEAAMYYVLALSFGLEGAFATLGMMAAGILMVTAISNLATSLPSSPGAVGPFEFFGAATLVFLGAERGVASAYAVALHIALLAPVTLAGLVYLWLENLSLSQLAKRSQSQRVVLPDAGNDER